MRGFRASSFDAMLQLLELCEQACVWCDERPIDARCEVNYSAAAPEHHYQKRDAVFATVSSGAKVAMSLLRARMGQAHPICQWEPLMEMPPATARL